MSPAFGSRARFTETDISVKVVPRHASPCDSEKAYGIAVVAPLLFFERQIAPGITHPVFFYAWVSVDLVWQILFLVLSTDPIRYRPMMLVSVLEKATAVIAIPWLYVLGRIGSLWLGVAAVDLVFGGLFVAAYRGTGRVQRSDGA